MHPEINYQSIDEALADPNFITTKSAFITGRAATGKTTLARRMQGIGYAYVEIDNICKTKVNPVFHLAIEQSIAIIHGKAAPEVEDLFISEIHKEMNLVPQDKKIIIEGTMSSIKVLNRIFSGNYADFTFIFLYPTDRARYKKRVMERFAWEVENDYQYLPIWHRIEKSLVDSYKKQGFAAPGMMQFIDELVDALYDGAYERYKIFADAGIKIKTVAV